MKEQTVRRIASFSVDHTRLEPGLYLSRVDGDVATYDLRCRRPNAGDYLDNETMHTLEHQFATYVRNSAWGEQVSYFGPMGCQTGFYLLLRGVPEAEVAPLVKETLRKIAAHEGPVFGASAAECGNYRTLNGEKAKAEAERYLAILEEKEPTLRYEE